MTSTLAIDDQLYAPGDRVEVTDDGDSWHPDTVTRCFVGPVSGRWVYEVQSHRDGFYAECVRPHTS